MPHEYTRGLFTIDGLTGPYKGYTDGGHWNGWACPVFERKVAERIAGDFRAQGDRHGYPGTYEARYDPDRDAFIFTDPNDDPYVFESDTVTVDNKPATVYFIGTRFWTWESA